MKLPLFAAFLIIGLVITAFANNPGGHMALLSWADSWCATNGPCTYNVYRGNSPGVCGAGKTPFANTANLSYEDDSVIPGTTYVYAVTALPATGGESTCSAEVQGAVSSVSALPVASLSGVTH
jgi:hypothetical protein